MRRFIRKARSEVSGQTHMENLCNGIKSLLPAKANGDNLSQSLYIVLFCFFPTNNPKQRIEGFWCVTKTYICIIILRCVPGNYHNYIYEQDLI